MTSIRPVVKWHGGKYYMFRDIISLFPEHKIYVEPFGGAASVLLNKEPAPVEVYNDLDHRIVRLFRVLRNHPEEFQRRLSLTPYAEEEFNQAKASDTNTPLLGQEKKDNQAGADEIELARRDYVRWRMSFGGQAESFSFTVSRSRRGMADVVSSFLSSIDDLLPQIVERFRRVQIMNRDALDVIREFDSPDTLFYCDPPYYPETRTNPDVYRHEYSEKDHEQLLSTLLGCQGKVVISGYDCDLYNDMLADWHKFAFFVPNHTAKMEQKDTRCEIIWRKPVE